MQGTLKLDLAGVPAGSRLYLGISGGLDSAYLAWRLLSMGHPLLLHHATYRTTQNRWPEEETAYRAVLDWLTAEGLTDWELLTTEVDLHGTPGYWLLDYEYLFWITGVHLRNRKRHDIKHVVVPSHRESRNTRGRLFLRMVETMRRTAERPITHIEPMKRYDRPAILGDMPEELIRLCWWCRTPKDGKPCHECNTCKVVDPALRKVGIRL